MATLKPFVLNRNDLNFLYKQVTFLPLFDVEGNAIIAWDGVGEVYDGHGKLIGNGGLVAGDAASLAAIEQYGTSYTSTTSLEGIRDVSGLNNNLLLTNASEGSVDQAFVRTVAANFDDYLKPLVAGDANAFYGAKTFDTNFNAPGIQYTPSSDYTTTVAADGTVAQANVVDYTARMVSQVITTGGATPLLDGAAGHAGGGHIVNFDRVRFESGDAAYVALIESAGVNPATLVDGAAVITDYGLLETLGHIDYQKTPGTPGSDEFFIGAENPGVAPTNSWFAYFGQFFDHGLDLIGKGAQGTTIKIALATDDPLYGEIGPDGRPATSVTISRANVSGKDANGDPTYINHTSPFIDQSQTYGSHEQMTTLLREWISVDGGATYHSGMELLDGQTLATAWKRPDGVMTTQTLPTLNELRDHVLDTGRSGLTWEDVLDYRNRDANGQLATGADAGNSGQALLLDMNNRFDLAHLLPSDGNADTNWDNLVAGKVADAIDYLNANGVRPGDSFGIVDGQLAWTLGSALPTGPSSSIAAGTVFTGANALYLWVNFGDFSIKSTTTAGVHAAVGEILMASVGDHYIAGDGRVNEDVGLTAIHHVFHEEHNFQIQNVINTIYTQDVATTPLDHAELHRWQINTGAQDLNGNFIHNQGTAGSADDVIAWDHDKLFPD